MSDHLESIDGELLCAEEALAISKLDAQNDLIRFFTDAYKGGEGGWRVVRDEFTERFGAPGFRGCACRGEHAVAAFFANYFLALRTERQRLEARSKRA